MKRLLTTLVTLFVLSVSVFAQEYTFRANKANGALYNNYTEKYEWGYVQPTDVEIKLYSSTGQMVIFSQTPQFFNLMETFTFPIFSSYLGSEKRYTARDANNVGCIVSFVRNQQGECWIFIIYADIALTYKVS